MNTGTLFVIVLLVIGVALAVRFMLRQRKSGSCGQGCAGCMGGCPSCGNQEGKLSETDLSKCRNDSRDVQ